MRFQDAYAKFWPIIQDLSRSQPVMGMEPDDIASEMVTVLWKATDTWDPEKGRFDVYWYSAWLNRRSDLNESYYAVKRVRAIPVDDTRLLDVPVTDSYVPMPPKDAQGMDSVLWSLLALGVKGTNARLLLEMSRRHYYDTLTKWRTDDVRDGLSAS